ncbi:hypothetical protein [Nocardioides sp. Soil796]|uniref:hypothetical protein n=1 Tax=Nocardioides sp. Soil796 TaxID=1736412 RepID=UPI00070CA0DB|nr:hypothetical protein [Nocardioides sp. Soil796]KRF16115.1 hypothetical protein ASH02_05835 [Nocardioides sp. Soil796]
MAHLDDLTGTDRRAQLSALRDLLADAITSTGARDLPALTARYLQVVDELADLPDPKKEKTISERIAARASRPGR